MIIPACAARRLSISALAGALLLASIALAPSRPIFAQPAERSNEQLLEHMEAMKDSLKAVAMGLSTEASPESLIPHIVRLQQHLLAAKEMRPVSIDDLPAEEHDAARLRYRAKLARALRDVANLEIELATGDADGAWAIIAGPLLKSRQAGHDEFQLED